MSHNDSNRRRTVIGIGMAAGAAFAAGLISLGTAGMASAAPSGTIDDPFTFPFGNPSSNELAPVDAQGYSVLFGAEDASGDAGAHNAALDTQLFQMDPTQAAAFYTNAATFEASNDHPLSDLIYALDPRAFYVQDFGDIHGSLAGADGGYLVPADGLGLLVTDLDYFLTGTGLTFILDPVVNALAGSF
jgi:hypothetical protein